MRTTQTGTDEPVLSGKLTDSLGTPESREIPESCRFSVSLQNDRTRFQSSPHRKWDATIEPLGVAAPNCSQYYYELLLPKMEQRWRCFNTSQALLSYCFNTAFGLRRN